MHVCYSLSKCCCKIKENEEDEDAVSFYVKVFNGNMEQRVYIYAASLVVRKEVRKRNEVMIELRKQRESLDVRGRYVRHSVAKVVFAVSGGKR